MIKVIKYTGEKTFMYPNGEIATPERILADYPAILTFTHIIETDENQEVLFAVQNLSATRTMFDIDKGLTEDEAITAIENIRNNPPVGNTEPTPEERIASALEFQNLLAM